MRVHKGKYFQDLLRDLDLLTVHIVAYVLPDEGGLLGVVVAEGEDEGGGELLFGEFECALQLVLSKRFLWAGEVRLRGKGGRR